MRDLGGLEWHDAALLSVEIDRRDPGERDELALAVRWPSERTSRVVFFGCNAIAIQMHGGYLGPDCILNAWESESGDLLRDVLATWARYPGGLTVSLKQFRVETNTTGGTITVVAEGWREEPWES